MPLQCIGCWYQGEDFSPRPEAMTWFLWRRGEYHD